tara:strand:- start:2670 stop:3029 length:360 start_codon:yes stop_codon:yes gene_type:complete
MATKITIANTIINTSLQVGDIAYYVPSVTTQSSNNVSIKSSSSDPEPIGKIIKINDGSIHVDTTAPYSFQVGDFLMFSKDKRVNNTSLLGYYADVTLSNNSTEEAELFSLGSEITQSSK